MEDQIHIDSAQTGDTVTLSSNERRRNLPRKDIREWLELVEKRPGELKKISGALDDLEMSSIAEIIFGECKDTTPAVLFDDIPGYPP